MRLKSELYANHTTLPSSKKPTLRGYVKTQP